MYVPYLTSPIHTGRKQIQIFRYAYSLLLGKQFYSFIHAHIYPNTRSELCKIGLFNFDSEYLNLFLHSVTLKIMSLIQYESLSFLDDRLNLLRPSNLRQTGNKIYYEFQTDFFLM